MNENNNIQLSYSQMQVLQDVQRQASKINEFKARLQAFEEISSLQEAKELAEKILPVSQEINHFRIGEAKCVVVNRPNMFRVSIDTESEFICYDFS